MEKKKKKLSKFQLPCLKKKMKRLDKIIFKFPSSSNNYIIFIFQITPDSFCLLWSCLDDKTGRKYSALVHGQLWCTKMTLKRWCFKEKTKWGASSLLRAFEGHRRLWLKLTVTTSVVLPSLGSVRAIGDWAGLGWAGRSTVAPTFPAARSPTPANPLFTQQQLSSATLVLITSITFPILLCVKSQLLIVGFKALYHLFLPSRK